jgi:ATP-binding cassette subfamily B protein
MNQNKINHPKLLKRLWQKIDKKYKKNIIFLSILTAISSVIEIISIGSIIPLLGALLSPDKILSNNYGLILKKYFYINSTNNLLIALTLIFVLSLVISNSIRYLLLRYQTNISHTLGAELSSKIYYRMLHQPYSFHINTNSSKIISGISIKVGWVVYNTLLPCLVIFSSLFLLLLTVSLLIYINPIYTLSLLLILGLTYYLILASTKKIYLNIVNKSTIFKIRC